MLAQVDVAAELWKLGPVVGVLGWFALHLYKRLDEQQKKDAKRQEADIAAARAAHDETTKELNSLRTEHCQTREEMAAIKAEARGINVGREVMERLSKEVLEAVSGQEKDV